MAMYHYGDIHMSPLAHVSRSTTSSASPQTQIRDHPSTMTPKMVPRSDGHDGHVLEMSRSIGGADGDHLALPGWAACPVAQDTDTQQAGSLYRATSTTLHIIDV